MNGSKPIRPVAWRSWGRVTGWFERVAVLMLVVLAILSVLFSSPNLLVNALYHNRESNILGLESMPADKRAKLVRRLCLSLQYLRYGSSGDPYDIPHQDQCQ
ncbi:hypothetical protein [Magnetospirillum gryphiswaldense]|uniref:hypothetical protein n=1 Tax=Magnetospirillum gryphiswaldense TaxID=55518 RepID=UPI000D225F91|nr:hypothetical protein [Magnetospirillum gryphiswaldense]AVM74869.1 hypothetical protein MSR1_23860 [Magnetospirillum gryphiswaldense MSR-1]AVM75630.1 hypothetical protein MSR1_31640 [Magnetospirillum gryphiswaldense MSR-1]AVM78772.1 hypothetical protein MSR1L_23860 [Magnetospirillum gryphiswaldense]AVM79533.1 hypothetical protein MSR1L_31640 [Magnetospirillum gryphiswaldense]